MTNLPNLPYLLTKAHFENLLAPEIFYQQIPLNMFAYLSTILQYLSTKAQC